jgi:serine/threonine-protein kinase
VHRDIKPHNLLAGPDGRVKIADFGIAHSLDGVVITNTGTVLGTAGYLAPEQSRGERVTPATDMYGLGVTLHQLLTGQMPGAEPPRAVPQPLRRAIESCLNPEPANRPTAEELALDLARRSAPGTTQILPPKSGATVYPPRPSSLARPRILIAATLVLLVIGIGALIATSEGGGGSGASPPPPAARHHHSLSPAAGPTLGQTPIDQASNLARWLREHSS